MTGVTRASALILVAACCACEPARPPASPATPPAVAEAAEEEDASFLRSEKLDDDVQELVVRAFGSDVPFTFEARVSAPLDRITRARFAERGVTVHEDDPPREETRGPRVHTVTAPVGALGLLTGDERVRAVRCTPPPLPEEPPPPEDTWRSKVERDLRIVLGARSACWFEVTIRFGEEPPPDAKRTFEAHGGRFASFGADEATGWVPVLYVPYVAPLPWVSFVEVKRR